MDEDVLLDEEYMKLFQENEKEQKEFDEFLKKSDDDFKKNVINSLDDYCNDLEKTYKENDEKLDKVLDKIKKGI